MDTSLGVFEEEDKQALEFQLVHTRMKARNFTNTLVKKNTSRSFHKETNYKGRKNQHVKHGIHISKKENHIFNRISKCKRLKTLN